MHIPFLRPSLPPIETWTAHLEESYAANRFANFGPLHERFCELTAARYAAPGVGVMVVANATAGLTAALIAAGVRGRVVLPAFTFAATLHAVIAAGCAPVLCDVRTDTWELDPQRLEDLLRAGDVGGVVPVRAFGFVRDLSDLFDLCRRHGAPVVVDAAASFGHPDRAGAIGGADGPMEVVSLHATKVFSIGEGGLVFAPRETIEALRRAMNFGQSPDRSFGDGGNAKVDEVRCAIGLAALGRIDGVVARRSAVVQRYRTLFESRPDIATLPYAPGPAPWQTFPVRFHGEALRAQIAAALAAAGVETRRYYWPAVGPGYHGRHRVEWTPAATPVSDALAAEMLCLPVYETMTAPEEAHVMAQVAKVLAAH